jgi:hypothetical protein
MSSKIYRAAELLLEQFERKTFPSCEACGKGERTIYCFTDKALSCRGEGKPKYHDELSDLIHKSGVDEDYGYSFVVDALEAIYGNDDEIEEDDLDEVRDGIEAPCYTSEVTAFFAAHSGHVSYIDEALSDSDHKDGICLLSQAYTIAMEEIFEKVRELVVEVAEEMEDEE